tara:strand:- start:2833 stop:3561 length:729 start_codon:yes stop_codon:yes gene_type:complete
MTDKIFIFGASSNIGIKYISSLKKDTQIIAHYNQSREKLDELKKINNLNLSLYKADLKKDYEVRSMIDEIEKNYGTPNKIILLASPRLEYIRFKEIKWEKIDQDIISTLRSYTLILNQFVPNLAKERRGKIVVMLSSVVLGIPPKFLTHYTILKYSLLGLVKSIASEYGDKNIQINSISPSMIDTNFISDLNEKLVEINVSTHPLKRIAEVSDIIPILEMLLSENSNYINGINIPVTGGLIY